MNLSQLKDYFNIEKWSINQPIIISDIYSELLKIKGVLSVVKVEFVGNDVIIDAALTFAVVVMLFKL